MKPALMQITSVCALSLLLLACSPEQSSEIIPAAPSAADTPKGLDYAFYKATVEPLFLRPRGGYIGSDAGCVACHTSQANAPLGLQELTMADGRVFWTEEQSRQNFVNVAKLVNPSDPDSSRLLNALLRRRPEANAIRAAFSGTAGTTVNTGSLQNGLPPAPTALELMWSRRWIMSFSLLRTADLRESDRKRDALR